MKVIKNINKIQELAQNIINKRNTIGFIPTMGALHAGHLALVQQAREENDFVMVSIFVNPAQFNNKADYERYPQPFDQDLQLIEQYVDYVFHPSVDDMYPDGFQSTIHIGALASTLEGKYRPGHFEGMATIVLKLFHICQPTRAYFGLKDYQQYLIVSQMVRDLNLPVYIVGVPTVREQSGLAYSSRNQLLTSSEQQSAPRIYQSLQKAKRSIKRGEKNTTKIEQQIREDLERIPQSKIDYVAVRTKLLDPILDINQDVVVLVAIHVGGVRLIDNITVSV